MLSRRTNGLTPSPTSRIDPCLRNTSSYRRRSSARRRRTYGDITCETTIPAGETGSAHLTARENGVMSGIEVFRAAFTTQNPAVTVTAAIKDGERFQAGQVLATVTGPVRDLLTAERIALNFTQRMSGIATMTAAFVDAVKRHLQ